MSGAFLCQGHMSGAFLCQGHMAVRTCPEGTFLVVYIQMYFLFNNGQLLKSAKMNDFIVYYVNGYTFV